MPGARMRWLSRSSSARSAAMTASVMLCWRRRASSRASLSASGLLILSAMGSFFLSVRLLHTSPLAPGHARVLGRLRQSDPAAVGDVDLAGGVARALGEQEQRKLGHLLGAADALE